MNQENVMPRETFWSRYASDFEARINYVAGKGEIDILKNHLSEVGDLGETLELGCGDGVFSRTIASQSRHLIATDWSEEMVEAFRANHSDNNDNISVLRENCLALTLENDMFDTVFMANLLHVIPAPEKALQECKRVLKPGGRIIILSFTMQGMGFFQKMGMLFRYLKVYGKPPAESRALTKEDAVKMLENEGFSILHDELIGNKVKSVFVISQAQ